MTLSEDGGSIRYNDFLTLSGVPAAAHQYRLGSRSALEWVLDQYRVKHDTRAGIVHDPNRDDEPEYIIRLIGRVLTTSVETVGIVQKLAGLNLGLK